MTGGLFAVLDDIALLLVDAATMSKVAAKKTAGILGDDLAVNAEKATGFRASRELPVLWAITKGSFINKLIILPLAFLLSALLPKLIVPILLIGGTYLSFEGVEKIYHTFFHRHSQNENAGNTKQSEADLAALEKAKISSAVRTDFILSVEIIILALSTVVESSLTLQIIVVSFIAVLATVGVYGFVALIVRMDDMGFYLERRAEEVEGPFSRFLESSGGLLIVSLPKIIRALGVIGTVAMLLVGGGMFTHNIHKLHDALHFMPMIIANLFVGLAVGTVVLIVVQVVERVKKQRSSSAA